MPIGHPVVVAPGHPGERSAQGEALRSLASSQPSSSVYFRTGRWRASGGTRPFTLGACSPEGFAGTRLWTIFPSMAPTAMCASP